MFTLFRSRGLFHPPSWFSRSTRFTFLETGPLLDGELELVEPSAQWVEAVMASARHPMTLAEDAALANLSRDHLADFLSASPLGRQRGDGRAGIVPAYHFWMRNHDRADLPIAGAVTLRIGQGTDLEMYYGHVGYHVYPPHRGRRFAERAVRLLLPLARRHGLNPLWITCNPDNFASQRTCQRLGATLVGTVAVPADHALFSRGEVAKCRYRLDDRDDADSGRSS